MAQIKTKFITDNAVNDLKERLRNNQWMRARNNADSADVNVIKVDASDIVQLPAGAQLNGVNIATAGSFAATDLSNLASVAINSDLIFDAGAASKLSTNDAVSAPTENLFVSSGSTSTSGNSGSLTLETGTSDADTGALVARSGGAATGQSGSVSISSGDAEISGVVAIASGASTAGASGSSTLKTGNAGLNDNTGQVFVNSGDTSGTGSTGNVNIYSGVTATGTTGNVSIATGDPSGAGTRGIISLGAEEVYIGAGDGTNDAVLSFSNVAGTFKTSIKALDGLAANYTLTLPPDDGTSGQVLRTDGSGVLTWVANGTSSTPNKENLTLDGTDITNQYKDLAQVIIASSMNLSIDGIIQYEGTDYTVSLTGGAGGKTRISFAGDLATAGAAALVSGDIMHFQYVY